MNNNMSILYIVHERLLGGASLSLVTLADEMQKRGHKVGVVVPFYFCPIAKELRRRQIKTYWVFFGWWMMSENWSFFLKLAFAGLYAVENVPAYIISWIANKGGYQVIHSNSSVIDVGSRAASMAGKCHVWHFREFGDLDYELIFLKGRKRSLGQIRKGNDEIVFISQSLQKHYNDLNLKERMRVIYNGVDAKYMNAHEHNNDKVVFLISGNLHKNKRQDLVLNAAYLLQSWGIDGYEVWIAGAAGKMKNSIEYAAGLKAFVEEKQLRNVKMLGRIADMNSIRRKADVEIVASNQEAFGRVTAEAMLSSNPVLASDSGANPELVCDGENGWLFENGNVQDLAKKMKMIIENCEEIQEMGNKAYQFASQAFLSEKNTEEIERLYRSLVY